MTDLEPQTKLSLEKKYIDQLRETRKLISGEDEEFWKTLMRIMQEMIVDYSDLTNVKDSQTPEDLKLEIKTRKLLIQFISDIITAVEGARIKETDIEEKLQEIRTRALEDSTATAKDEYADGRAEGGY
jgi:hypothetical protein